MSAVVGSLLFTTWTRRMLEAICEWGRPGSVAALRGAVSASADSVSELAYFSDLTLTLLQKLTRPHSGTMELLYLCLLSSSAGAFYLRGDVSGHYCLSSLLKLTFKLYLSSGGGCVLQGVCSMEVREQLGGVSSRLPP